MIKVRVLFFGAARDAVGQEQIEVELESPINADGARAKLLSAYPSLQRFGKSLLFAVNQQYAQSDREISEGDELAVFPPVSGGSAQTKDGARCRAPILLRLTTYPIVLARSRVELSSRVRATVKLTATHARTKPATLYLVSKLTTNGSER